MTLAHLLLQIRTHVLNEEWEDNGLVAETS